MSATFEYSNLIGKPVEKVFKFIAVNHVQNHPRWDPDIELWLDKEGPLHVGTVIHRRNSRSGKPVEGRMEVVKWVPNKAFSTLVHDGPVVINARITFETMGENQTKLITRFEIPSMDESMDKSFLYSRMERSAQNQRHLIESEM